MVKAEFLIMSSSSDEVAPSSKLSIARQHDDIIRIVLISLFLILISCIPVRDGLYVGYLYLYRNGNA